MSARAIVEGNPVLIVIDTQEDTFAKDRCGAGIPIMSGYTERVSQTRALVDVAHEVGIPVFFVKEVHRPDHVDFRRELDGSEDVH